MISMLMITSFQKIRDFQTGEKTHQETKHFIHQKKSSSLEQSPLKENKSTVYWRFLHSSGITLL